MDNLGIFGGSFEPFHNEHIEVCKNAIKELNLDKLLVMPTYIAPHKPNHEVTDENVRKDIIKLSIKGIDKAELCEYELLKGDTSYTYQTVEHFSGSAKNLYFIVGADMLLDFKTWKNPQTILDNCTLAVFGREGYEFDEGKEHEYFLKTFGKDFKMLSYVGKNVSATKIRVYSALGLDISKFVAPEVKNYILEKKPFYKKYEKYTDYVLQKEKPSRVIHTAGVIICALSKCRELDLSEDKVFLSALLHDCAKYQSKYSYRNYRSPQNMQLPVEHAFLGAYIAENVLGIKDNEIVDAIRYHTTGRRDMTTLEKLIFTADMIEEGRSYDGVEELRKAFEESAENGFVNCIREELKHLRKTLKDNEIFPLTLQCYDYYVGDRNRK